MPPKFQNYMSLTRFQHIKKVIPAMMEDKDGLNPDDDWWQHRGFIDGFNKNRSENIISSAIKVLDETMSALCPR